MCQFKQIWVWCLLSVNAVVQQKQHWLTWVLSVVVKIQVPLV